MKDRIDHDCVSVLQSNTFHVVMHNKQVCNDIWFPCAPKKLILKQYPLQFISTFGCNISLSLAFTSRNKCLCLEIISVTATDNISANMCNHPQFWAEQGFGKSWIINCTVAVWEHSHWHHGCICICMHALHMHILCASCFHIHTFTSHASAFWNVSCAHWQMLCAHSHTSFVHNSHSLWPSSLNVICSANSHIWCWLYSMILYHH